MFLAAVFVAAAAAVGEFRPEDAPADETVVVMISVAWLVVLVPRAARSCWRWSSAA